MILWEHQERAVEHVLSRTASMLAMPMGTGKSAVVVQAMRRAKATRALILCPRSVIGVWPVQIKRFWPVNELPIAPPVYCPGSESTALEKATWLRTLGGKSANAGLIAILNYETFRTSAVREAVGALNWDFVVLDESHRVKQASGVTSKAAWAVASQATRRVCLTGTPMPHSPLDLFGQFRFLDTSVFGKWYTHFRARYAVCDRKFPSKVIRFQNLSELEAKAKPYTFVCDRDVVSLPPETHTEIPITLGAKAAAAYKAMERDFVVELQSGQVTAANALVKLLRLQQLTAGFLPVDETDRTETLCTAKRDALAELIESAGDQRIVVFCQFHGELDHVRDAAEGLGRQYREISGRLKDGLTSSSTLAADAAVSGVQLKAGGVGIDLTAASIGVYFSTGFNWGDYSQSLARIRRPGQERHVAYYYLVAKGTVDEKVMKALGKREAVIETVMQELRR